MKINWKKAVSKFNNNKKKTYISIFSSLFPVLILSSLFFLSSLQIIITVKVNIIVLMVSMIPIGKKSQTPFAIIPKRNKLEIISSKKLKRLSF